jgi:PhnB protein
MHLVIRIAAPVRDPFGHEWMIGHSIEEVTPEEMQRRYTALMKSS